MFVYLLILLIVVFGVFHFDIRKQTFGKKFYAIFVSVVITLMIGLRYKVGGDALTYEYYFVHLPDLQDYFAFLKRDVSFGYQPLFTLFVAICKSINPDYYFYQFVHAVIINSIISWFIYTNAQKFFTAILWFYGLGIYFYFTFDIQREIFAICCFLLAYKHYMNNRWIPYYLFAIVGFFFHISATILFILPFFKLVKLKQSYLYIITIISLLLVFFKSQFYSSLSFLMVTEGMAAKGKVYSEMEFSISGLIFFFFGRVVLFVPFALAAIKFKEKEKQTLVFGVFMLSCLAQVMVGFDRMLNYLLIPLIVYISDFIYAKNTYKFRLSKNLIILSTYMCLFFVVGIKVVMDLNVKDRARYQAVFFPYSSIFEKEVCQERENYMIELWKR